MAFADRNVGVTGQKSIDQISSAAVHLKASPIPPTTSRRHPTACESSASFQASPSARGSSANGSIPTTIEVSEGKQKYFGVGAQYSTIDGFELQGWGNRNLFGQAECCIRGSISRLGKTTNYEIWIMRSVSYSKPGAFFRRNL